MGIYNFQKRFVPKIESGEKKHTIRAKRKHPDKPGNTLHLFTGLRTKAARCLMRTKCTRVEDIKIFAERGTGHAKIEIEGARLTRDECEQLASCDGFESFNEMMTFWNGRLPFSGDLIHWA